MEKKQEVRQVDTSKGTPSNVKSRQRKAGFTGGEDKDENKSDSLNDSNPIAFKSIQALALRIGPRSQKRRSIQNPLMHGHGPPEKDIDKSLYQLQKDDDIARNELKHTYRENRGQSLNMRDPKKAQAISHDKNAHLREQNAHLREAILAHNSEKLTTGEKSEFIERCEIPEGYIPDLQYERQRRDRHLELLTTQTREANEEKSFLEAECRKLQRQVRELSNNLTECRDELLGLQPTSQVPDNEISDLYSDLDQQITGWVDERTENTEILEGQFEKIKAPKDLPGLFGGYLSSDQLRMAKKYPESQPTLLRYLVHRSLDTFVFSHEIYLFGLDSRHIELLTGIEEEMKRLEPHRDTVALRRWRSETLQGLLKMDAFIEEQNRQAQFVAQTFQSALSCLMTHIPESDSGWEDLHSQIIHPAVNLANTLRLSTTDYQLISHPFVKDRSSNVTGTFRSEIKKSNMIDIATHKIIRPDSVLKVAEDGRIGEEVLVIIPALLRLRKEGEGTVLVCKPTVLVRLDEPMAKRNRGIKALGAWTPSWLSGEEAVS